jgi:hypothetical protein
VEESKLTPLARKNVIDVMGLALTQRPAAVQIRMRDALTMKLDRAVDSL